MSDTPHLFSDARVVRAAAMAFKRAKYADLRGDCLKALPAEESAACILAAAVAALPREEIIEAFAKAAFADRWPGRPWNAVSEASRATWRGNTRAGFEAIGLIPDSPEGTP